MNYCFRFLFLILLFISLDSFAQGTISKPQIFNYSSSIYKGGLQNWCVAQDSKGVMYFGNNEGLLSFDGRNWRIHPLPNATVVRSVAIDKNDRIYVGGQDELGYFEGDDKGMLVFHSLKEKLQESERFFSDVWHTEILGDDIFFHTSLYIFRLSHDKMVVDRAKSSWQFLGQVKGDMYAYEAEMGLMRYENGIWKSILKSTDIASDVITDIVSYNADTLLISTLRNGLYTYINGQLAPKIIKGYTNLNSYRISCLQDLENDRYAIGTNSGGLFIINASGDVMQHYVYKGGLQTNHIRAIFTDKNSNLWLATDDGIDYITINSSVGYIQPDQNTTVSAYSHLIYGGRLFIGTSNGLYATELLNGNTGRDIGMSQANFKKIAHSDGQVWSLNEFNGRLLMAHEDGSFEIKGDQANAIYRSIGTWLHKATTRVLPFERLIAGTYAGLWLIGFDGNNFNELGHINKSNESLRFIHYDDNANAVWVSHPYRGVSKLWISKDFKEVVKEKSYTLPEAESSILHNYLFFIKNKVIVCNPNYIYEYDEKADQFVKSADFAALNGLPIQYMKEDKFGNIWFVSNKRLSVLDYSKSSKQHPFILNHFPMLNGKILGGFESVYVHDLENVFINGQKGGILLDYKGYLEKAIKPNVLLRLIKISNQAKEEQVLYGGNGSTAAEDRKISNAFNTVHFEFSSTNYEQQEQVEYSYLLDGLETKWSSWSNKGEKEYTNLGPGDYVFKVKSRNGVGNESEEATIAFTVAPPWYMHPFMYVLYAIFFISFPFWILAMQRKKLRRVHQQELQLTQLEIEKKEKEVIKLRNQNLEAEIGYMDKELANLTMNIIQRGEALGKIKEGINRSMEGIKDAELKSNFKQLTRIIRSAEQTNDDWEKFNIHFNHANENFFLRLKKEHPDLTQKELQLCAFLRMNLSSKEIAQLMHVTAKAVEVSRYRLRKKLKIDPEINLYNYLLEFAKPETPN